MTRAEFDKMMERNFKHFNVPKDNYGGLLLWIPKYKEFLSMHFGDGTNADDLEEGCEDYIAELAGCPLEIVAGNNDFLHKGLIDAKVCIFI